MHKGSDFVARRNVTANTAASKINLGPILYGWAWQTLPQFRLFPSWPDLCTLYTMQASVIPKVIFQPRHSGTLSRDLNNQEEWRKASDTTEREKKCRCRCVTVLSSKSGLFWLVSLSDHLNWSDTVLQFSFLPGFTGSFCRQVCNITRNSDDLIGDLYTNPNDRLTFAWTVWGRY